MRRVRSCVSVSPVGHHQLDSSGRHGRTLPRFLRRRTWMQILDLVRVRAEAKVRPQVRAPESPIPNPKPGAVSGTMLNNCRPDKIPTPKTPNSDFNWFFREPKSSRSLIHYDYAPKRTFAKQKFAKSFFMKMKPSLRGSKNKAIDSL